MPTCTHAELPVPHFEDHCYNLWFNPVVFKSGQSAEQIRKHFFKKKKKKAQPQGLSSGLQSQNLRARASGICMKTKDKTKLPDSYDWCSTKVWELLMYFSNSKVLCFNALWTFFMSCGYTLCLLLITVAFEVLCIFYHISNVEIQGLNTSFMLLCFFFCAFIVNTSFLHMLSEGILIRIQKQK